MHFRAVGYASTGLYALILATFLLPWLDVSSVGIAGFKIAMGEYDIPPTGFTWSWWGWRHSVA